MYKKPRLTFVFIILFTLLAIYIDLPKIHVFGHNLQHPSINLNFFKKDLEPKLGLDLAGGVQLTMTADMSKIEEADREDAVDSAKNIIEDRINALGVAEPVVQTAKTQNDYRLIVEIPGVSDIDQAVNNVKKSAHLEFKVLAADAPPESTIAAFPEHFVETGLTGRDLKRATPTASQDPQDPGFIVSLAFSEEGTKKLEQITTENLNGPMAMFLDGEPISWPPPVIRAIIPDGNAQVSGNFTSKEAKELAINLNAGALPVPFRIESQTRVGPTIGQTAIDKSIFATLIGLISVAIFMIVYYRILGIFAVIALLVYTAITFAVFKIIPVTLTLASIAGFVLSIGMAVDANILIFERIKEELRWGKPKHEALYAGFERAWSSIRDSNVSSLITTAILFNFGTGAIRGFALTLALGILVSLFSAITVTRTLIRIFWVGKV